MTINITEDNFFAYAMSSYKTPCFIEQEFLSDLNHIKYIKRLFQRYNINGVLKERLILNHLIMLYNVFEKESCTRILFFRFKPSDYPTLKTFLLYLGHLPEVIHGIDNVDIITEEIIVDNRIVERLGKI